MLDGMRYWLDHLWMARRASEHVDGELAGREQDRARRHLSRCPDCRALVRGLRSIVAALGSVGSESGNVTADVIVAWVRRQLFDASSETA